MSEATTEDILAFSDRDQYNKKKGQDAGEWGTGRRKSEQVGLIVTKSIDIPRG